MLMQKNKSFTLIELLVVIVIIGILAGVIMISTSSSIDKANFAKAQAFSSTVQNELLLNLVSEWTFDNPSNIGQDSWGNYNGTLNNFANPATSTSGLAGASECVFNTCIRFDGTNDHINLNDSFSFIATSQEKTISAWFKSSVTDYTASSARIVTLHRINGGSAFALAILGTNDNIGLYYTSTGGTSLPFMNSNVKVSTNWTYVVGVQDRTAAKIYVNGIKANSANNADATVIDNPANALVGAYSGTPTYFFKGLMDDIRIYDAALSSAKVKQNYIAGLDSLLSKSLISKQEYNERINNLAYDN